jgi:hypothetical protein
VARKLYLDEDFGIELDKTVYALDTTTIDLCLSLFPWAIFKQGKNAIKLHTILDLRGNIPTFIHISEGRLHEINILDDLVPETTAIYFMVRTGLFSIFYCLIVECHHIVNEKMCQHIVNKVL